MRVRIAVTVGQSMREVQREVLGGWLNLKGAELERFVVDICGWGFDDSMAGREVISIPVNKENEAKGTVVREEVRFDREFHVVSFHQESFVDGVKLTNNSLEFARVVRRAYEQPA